MELIERAKDAVKKMDTEVVFLDPGEKSKNVFLGKNYHVIALAENVFYMYPESRKHTKRITNKQGSILGEPLVIVTDTEVFIKRLSFSLQSWKIFHPEKVLYFLDGNEIKRVSLVKPEGEEFKIY